MEQELKFLNVLHWHKSGYFGKDVKVALIDKFDYHISKIKDIKSYFSPGCDLKVFPPTIPGYNDAFDYNPDILLISLNEVYGGINQVNQMIENGTIVFNSAGNDGSKGETGMTINKDAFFVGAYELIYGKPVKSEYSSYGRGWVDIASIAKYTSYAGPKAGFMYSLLVEKYKEEYNTRPSFKVAENFILSNCIDLEEDGKDLKSGYGLFVLPSNLDLEKYRKDDLMQPKRITDMSLLHWKAKKVIQLALDNANARIELPNVELRIFESVRTEELQTYYHDNGWAPYPIPTFHNVEVGLASDAVVYVDGQPTWDDEWLWVYIVWGEEAVKLGLTWGGNWKSRDLPHVQLDDGLSSQQIRDGVRPSWFYDKEKDYTDHWAEKGIDYCLNNGIMKGYDDGKFHPDEPLTRAQYAWMKYQEAIEKAEV